MELTPYPHGWNRGELLNVRNYGATVHVTRLGEEFDPRAMNGITFESGWDAQEFISWWYAPEAYRAMCH